MAPPPVARSRQSISPHCGRAVVSNAVGERGTVLQDLRLGMCPARCGAEKYCALYIQSRGALGTNRETRIDHVWQRPSIFACL